MLIGHKVTISSEPRRREGFDINEELYNDLRPPLIMGIINVTPDSFSDGGQFGDHEEAVSHGLRLVEEGADILDVGGESTRPFADPVSIDEEKERVLPVIKGLISGTDVPVSIDTRNPEVAEACVGAGASIVNDVNALREEGMVELVARTGSSVVLMHMKGTPEDMQLSPSYDDVISEVYDFLKRRIDVCVSSGVERSRIFIDPGIGFGKRVFDNLVIIKELDRFLDLGCPILLGASRKSFIGHVLDMPVDRRLEGSLAAAQYAVMKGASVIRCHDVGETRRALDTLMAIEDPERYL